MFYPPVIVINILANAEFLNGDNPIAIPIPIDINVLVVFVTIRKELIKLITE